ncbi:MAG: 1-phosphofructokinase family hexose kinase [Rhodobacter sp.]|nr:1-phosphofructokinase family hexose kinase [Rhodobacter sp.]
MSAILTVTLNPALDIGASVARMQAGPKLRLDGALAEPGGGGINVARAAVKLGGRARAIAALGGATGQRIADLLAGSGVDLVVVRVPGETRQNLAVRDRADGQQYRLQFPGPDWTAAMAETMLARIVAESAAQGQGQGAVVVLSGSQPPGLDPGFAQDLARRIGAGGRLIVDTSGPALARLTRSPQVAGHPHVLRMDQAESEAAAAHPLSTIADSLDFAQALVARGVADCVVLARGAEGSVLATAQARLHCAPPPVPVESRIGAGDSFTAGFALTLAQGGDWGAALVAGTAAAAAAVMTPGTELCRGDDARDLAPRCVLSVA